MVQLFKFPYLGGWHRSRRYRETDFFCDTKGARKVICGIDKQHGTGVFLRQQNHVVFYSN